MMGDNTTLDEAFDFLAERIKTEEDNYDGDIPNHGTEMVVADAADLLQTVTSIEMAHDMAEDEDDIAVDQEQFDEALEEAAVDILSSLAALQYERDLDIAEAVEDRISFIKDYAAFEDALEDADGRSEEMEVVDEYMTNEIAEEMGVEDEPSGPTIGDNVDADDYDHDRIGGSYQ